MLSREYRARCVRLAALTACVAFLAGCSLGESGNNNVAAPIQPDRRHSTPESLMVQFALAHTDSSRSLPAVMSALHPDFHFRFTQDDRLALPGLPESIDRAGMEHAIGRVFDSANSLHMAIRPLRLVATEACSPEPGAPSCGLYEVLVDLTVEFPGEQEPLTYLVHGLADIAVSRDPADPGEWVIYEIVDRTTELPQRSPQATEQATWGAVLGPYFLHPNKSSANR